MFLNICATVASGKKKAGCCLAQHKVDFNPSTKTVTSMRVCTFEQGESKKEIGRLMRIRGSDGRLPSLQGLATERLCIFGVYLIKMF